MCYYKKQDTLFIDMSALESKNEGRVVVHAKSIIKTRSNPRWPLTQKKLLEFRSKSEA